jgi:hypothetical protein
MIDRIVLQIIGNHSYEFRTAKLLGYEDTAKFPIAAFFLVLWL